MKKKLKKATLFSPTALALAACGGGGSNNNNTTITSNQPIDSTVNVVVVDSFKSAADGGNGHGEKVVDVFDEANFGSPVVVEYELNLWDDDNPIKQVIQDLNPDVINTSWVVNDHYAQEPMVESFNDPIAGSVLRDVLDTGVDAWNNNITIVSSSGNNGISDAASAP